MRILFTDPVQQFERPETTTPDVVLRIRKMLDRGLHKETPPAEAENALRLAQREMRKYNLDQQRVFEQTADSSEISTNCYRVCVTNSKGGLCSQYRMFDDLTFACEQAFSVASCTSQETSFCFYGMEEPARIAAYAFVAYGRYIVELANAHTPEVDIKDTVSKYKAMYEGRKSFVLGIISGLLKAQRREQKAERNRHATLREYIELYEHLKTTQDDNLQDVCDALAEKLGIDGDCAGELVVYEKMEIALKDAASTVAEELGVVSTRDAPSAKRSSSMTDFSQGVRIGKKMRIGADGPKKSA